MKHLVILLVLLLSVGGCRLLLSATDIVLDVETEYPLSDSIDDPNSPN